VRAVEPIEGAEHMARRRGMPATRRDLSNGPGKLCRALGIDGSAYGVDLTRGALTICRGPRARHRIARSPRIGVDYAGDWAHRPWRFFDATSRYVSRPPRARLPAMADDSSSTPSGGPGS